MEQQHLPAPNDTPFVRLHQLWQQGDMEGFLALVHDDVEWSCNVDGQTMPYAASAYGREDLRFRLELLLRVFEIKEFTNLHFELDGDVARSATKLEFVHRVTLEPISLIVRFAGRAKDGLLVSMQERVDSNYVAAYERFMRYLMDGLNKEPPVPPG